MKSDIRGRTWSWKTAGRFAAFGFVGLLATGCQSSMDPPTQVWGTVRYHGKPVKEGVIVLVPLGGFGDTWGMGVIESDGAYKILPSHAERPIAAGRYGISFRLPTQVTPQRFHHKFGQDDVDKKEAEAAGATPEYHAATAPSGSIPDKYLHADHPVFSIDLGKNPVQVDITLLD